MSAHRTGTGQLPPHAVSGLATAIESAGRSNQSTGARSRTRAAEPTTPMETAVAALPDAPVGTDPERLARPPVAPGGDVEPWAVLEPSPAEGVQMELVVSNPTAETSALDGVRDALRDMHREGVANSPADRTDRSSESTQRSSSRPSAGPEHRESHRNGDGGDSVALPTTTEETLRAAVIAGRKAAAEEPGPSAVEATPQPRDPELTEHRPATVASTNTVEPHADDAGLEDDSPQELPSQDPTAPAGALDDDFGPLTTDDSPRSERRRPTLKGWALGAAGLTVIAILVGAGYAALGDDHDAAEQPTSAAAGTGAVAAPRATTSDVTWRAWRGMLLPVSTRSGPSSWAGDGDHAGGFARTPLGAAIAAANLSVRVDPAAGEAAWRGVLKDQTVGDSARLEAALEAAPAPSSGDAGGPGVLTGWRLSRDPAAGKVVVHLAVDTPDGAQDFAIPLAWHHGDWALNIPGPSKPIFVVSDTNGRYAPFQGEQ